MEAIAEMLFSLSVMLSAYIFVVLGLSFLRKGEKLPASLILFGSFFVVATAVRMLLGLNYPYIQGVDYTEYLYINKLLNMFFMGSLGYGLGPLAMGLYIGFRRNIRV